MSENFEVKYINDKNSLQQTVERLQVLACDVSENSADVISTSSSSDQQVHERYNRTRGQCGDSVHISVHDGVTPNNIIQRDDVRRWLDAQACGGTQRKRRSVNKRQRLAANTRERNRMLQLNEAFDSLRQAIPRDVVVTSGASSLQSSADRKPSRIQTLRLACDYIEFMTDLLQKSGSEANFGTDFKNFEIL